MITFEISVEPANEVELVRFSIRAKKLAGIPGEVAVLVTGNRRIQELNRRFRRQDRPTDVLSFARSNGGDIAISATIATENATLYGHTPSDEIKILILHGMLHLAGYDHETDHGLMGAKEAELRHRLKLPSSLIERARPAPPKAKRSSRKEP